MFNIVNKKLKFNRYAISSSDGVVLIIAITLLGITLSISLGIFIIFYSEYQFTKQSENSTTAIFAADAGLEEVLYNYRILRVSGESSYDALLDNGTLFRVTVTQNAGRTTINSKGCFHLSNIGLDPTSPSDVDVAVANCDSQDAVSRSLEATY